MNTQAASNLLIMFNNIWRVAYASFFSFVFMQCGDNRSAIPTGNSSLSIYE
ncbi:hypothetical protein yinte0001_13920 [Yersinia intermedia ATCC 29909]|nr:hypothetical protein yinte0001_13920 [Yersinia intermedia ATCC 29909]